MAMVILAKTQAQYSMPRMPNKSSSFGATSSPAVATYRLRKIAQDKAKSKRAAEFICSNFYMDDGIISVDSTNEAIQLMKDAREICGASNFLHK